MRVASQHTAGKMPASVPLLLADIALIFAAQQLLFFLQCVAPSSAGALAGHTAIQQTGTHTVTATATTVTTMGASALDGVGVLYNNDAENLLTVRSRYHREMDPINASVIRGSVHETRGTAHEFSSESITVLTVLILYN